MIQPIDRTHAECLAARNQIRDAFMKARQRVATAPLGQCPPKDKENR